MSQTKSGAKILSRKIKNNGQNFLSRKIKNSGQSQPNIMWSGSLFSDKNIKNSGVLGHSEVWGNISHKKRIKVVGSGGTLHYNNVFQGTFQTESVQCKK